MNKQLLQYCLQKRRSRRCALGIIILFLVGCGEPNTQDLKAFVEATRQASSGKEFPPLPEIEPYEPFTYDAQGLRDPFAVSKFVVDALTREEQQERQFVDNGIRPPDHIPEELEKYALGSLSMVGTFRDPSTDELWALIKAPDGIVHKVREGNHMGQHYGEVYSISEQRIDLQEIVPDSTTGGWAERDAYLSLNE